MKHIIITLCLALFCSMGLIQATSTAHEYLPDKVLSYGQSSTMITSTQEMTADCSEIYVNFSLIQKIDFDEILPDAIRKEKHAFLREINVDEEKKASELLHASNIKMCLSDCNEDNMRSSTCNKLRSRCSKKNFSPNHLTVTPDNTNLRMSLHSTNGQTGFHNLAMTEFKSFDILPPMN